MSNYFNTLFLIKQHGKSNHLLYFYFYILRIMNADSYAIKLIVLLYQVNDLQKLINYTNIYKLEKLTS